MKRRPLLGTENVRVVIGVFFKTIFRYMLLVAVMPQTYNLLPGTSSRELSIQCIKNRITFKTLISFSALLSRSGGKSNDDSVVVGAEI